MFGIGMSEMIIICAVALLVFGPEELPQIVKKIARGLGEVRKASDDLRRSIDLDDDDEDRRARTEARARLADAGPSSGPSSGPSPSGTSPPAAAATTTAGAVDLPPVVPGSALTPAHGDDAPIVVAAAGAVAVGEDPDDDARDVGVGVVGAGGESSDGARREAHGAEPAALPGVDRETGVGN
jgi:sec-independent protein translocase protein TatB